MKAYNLDKALSISLNDFYPARSYKYKTEIKFFGITFRKEGFYCPYFSTYLGSEIPEHHTLRDGELFENPEVVIRFEDGSRKTYCYDRYQDAKILYDDLTSIGKWLTENPKPIRLTPTLR